MKKNRSDKLHERAGGTGGNTASKASPSRKSPKPCKRILPLLGAGSIQIIDMRAVLK